MCNCSSNRIKRGTLKKETNDQIRNYIKYTNKIYYHKAINARAMCRARNLQIFASKDDYRDRLKICHIAVKN